MFVVSTLSNDLTVKFYRKFCYWLIFLSFQTCVNFYLLWNTERDVLHRNVDIFEWMGTFNKVTERTIKVSQSNLYKSCAVLQVFWSRMIFNYSLKIFLLALLGTVMRKAATVCVICEVIVFLIRSFQWIDWLVHKTSPNDLILN